MEKEFVPYEQALALKELGFEDLCFGWYSKDGTFYEGKMTIHQGLLSAPLYQQAFRWFREKYGLTVGFNTMYLSKGKDWDCYISKISAESSSWDSIVKGTYEEAELECLVKLIDIVKKQNLKG
jgi:hypothetical protein